MFCGKSTAVFLASIISVASSTACSKADGNQPNMSNTGDTGKTVIVMEMDANYSDTDPFENGRLFCVSENVETLDAEVFFRMDGERGMVEIKDRNADDILWSNTWDKNVDGDTDTITLNNLHKDKDYVVRFTGTKINHAVVTVTFENEMVQEKARPSK